MNDFNVSELDKLYVPPEGSHKGQNGKLLVIGGSHLFHAASLWALNIASRIVDMVFYSSVPENNEIVEEAKKEFRNGIVVPRTEIDNYIKEADCIVLGPGMMREDMSKIKNNKSKIQIKDQKLEEINIIKDEGVQSYYLTQYLLEKYPEKKWVIDAGALQMMEPEWLMPLKGNVVITPHAGEFERVISKIKNEKLKISIRQAQDPEKIEGQIKNKKLDDQIKLFAKEFKCIVLLKGREDLVCLKEECVVVKGGNAGMTKGGTGDVLAGLVGSLACKNDLWLSAKAGSYINKRAGDSLFEKVGYYFNSSDLIDEIPRVVAELIGDR